jgi:hypothetical protein
MLDADQPPIIYLDYHLRQRQAVIHAPGDDRLPQSLWVSWSNTWTGVDQTVTLRRRWFKKRRYRKRGWRQFPWQLTVWEISCRLTPTGQPEPRPPRRYAFWLEEVGRYEFNCDGVKPPRSQ